MNHELIERYVYAATKRLPRKTREDISLELHSLIEDMLDERCGTMTPNEKDIRVILTELGTPHELYIKYNTDHKDCLIGEPYYSTYKYLLGLVSLCVGLSLSILGTIITLCFTPTELMLATGFEWIGITVQTLVSIFAGLTLTFACFDRFPYFDRYNLHFNNTYNLDTLPDVPKKETLISKWDCIAELVLSLIFLVSLTVSNQLFTFTFNETTIGVFDTASLKSAWILIVGLVLMTVVNASIKLLEGNYTKKVVVSTLITNGISAILSGIWLLQYKIISEEAVSFVQQLFEEGHILNHLISNVNVVLFGIILFSTALDCGIVLYKGWNSK